MTQPTLSSLDRPWPAYATQQIFPLDDHRLPVAAAARIMEQIVRAKNNLADGSAEDWPSYRWAVGRIRGLEMALGICQEIEKELNR